MKPALLISLGLAGLCTTSYAAEQSSASSDGNLLQVVFGLILFLGLLVAAAWMLKRFGPKNMVGGTTVRIVGGVSVGSRERVLVIEAADQWIVIGVAPGRVNTLATMPRQENTPLAESTPVGKNFSDWLKHTIEKRNGN